MKPKITEQPESLLSKYCGEEAELRVVAEGPGKIRYQWKKNGKIYYRTEKMYQGATNYILTMNPLQPSHAGQYSYFIESDHGTTESKQVNLILNNIKIILSKLSHV